MASQRMHRAAGVFGVALVGAGLTWAVVVSPRVWIGRQTAEPHQETTGSDTASRLYPTVINRPAGPPRVDLGLTDARGQPVTASCSSCHATRAPDRTNAIGADLDEFHQGLTFQHGSLTCLSCHSPADYDSLRLSNDTLVPYVDVMTLCSQCHGPQRRDYDHGAHGGMTGYWDLTRGPRQRNTCTDCHDPHAPAFPMMQPTFKPKDRFLEPEVGHDGEAGHG